MFVGQPKHIISKGLRDSILFQLLLETASLSDIHFKHAAAVVDKQGFLQGLGYNHFEAIISSKLSKVRSKQPCSTHAEVAALRATNRRCLKGSSLIVIRKTGNNQLAMSKPCKHCEAFIDKHKKKYGLKDVCYSCCESYKQPREIL